MAALPAGRDVAALRAGRQDRRGFVPVSRDTRTVLFTKDQSEQPDVDEIVAPKLPADRVVHVHCRNRVNKCTVDFWIAGSESLPDARAAQRVQITYVSSGYPDLRVEYVGRRSIELAIVGDWLRRLRSLRRCRRR
jgi:hypothetical protein